MDVDRTELNNLIGGNVPLEKQLLRDYEGWADATGVLDWHVLEPVLLKAWNIKTVHG
jgi:hypothetical protein